MQCIAYGLSEILSQPLTDWIKSLEHHLPDCSRSYWYPKTELKLFFLSQLLPQSFEPFGELLNITIVLIIVITSICKSRALNTSTSFHFIFYHKLKKKNKTTCTDIFFDWLLSLFQRSRMPCFLNPGHQESERWGCIPLPAMGSCTVIVDTRGLTLAVFCWLLYCL